MTRTEQIAARLAAAKRPEGTLIKVLEIILQERLPDWDDGDIRLAVNAPSDLAYLLGRVEELEAWQREAMPFMAALLALSHGTQLQVPLENLIAEAKAGQEVE